MKKKSGEEVSFTGTIVDIIRFKASVEKAGVLKIRDGEKRLRNVIGVVDELMAGDVVQVVGIERSHPTHGLQVRASTIRTTFPNEKKEVIEWFIVHLKMDRLDAEAVLDGWETRCDEAPVGVAPHGEEERLTFLWECLLPSHPLHGTTSLGLVREAMKELFDNLELNFEYHQLSSIIEKKYVMDALVDMGLSTKEAFILHRERGLAVIDEIKVDPYVLYYYVEDTPFEKVDKIYLDRDDTLMADDLRVRALCVHKVREFVENGDTAVRYDDFIDLMEESHSYLKARQLLCNLHMLEETHLTLYGTNEMGLLIQPKNLARYEHGFAKWLITGHHPEGSKKKELKHDDYGDDDSFSF